MEGKDRLVHNMNNRKTGRTVSIDAYDSDDLWAEFSDLGRGDPLNTLVDKEGHEEEIKTLAKNIAKLQDFQREVVILCVMLGHTHEEAANILGTSHQAVSKSLKRALHNLRKMYGISDDYKITTGWDVQDLAFVFGESSQHEQTVSFSVSWLSLARIFITKTDEASGKNLAGAVFGVYSDPGCTNLIVQMPATDANGSSSVEITATQDTVYLKEITPPKGYAYTASALNVRVVAGQDSSLTITNIKAERQKQYRVRKRNAKRTNTEREEKLWQELTYLQGCLFTTSKGLDFTYTIKGGEMFVDRKEKSITRATVMKTYQKVVELDGIVKGPKVLGTFGASYLYPVFVKMGLIKTAGA